jgi:hypothetical protein
VNIWHWKASRQYQAVAGRAFESEPEAPPPQSWKVYGLPPQPAPRSQPPEPERGPPSFLTALDAGNVHESDQLAGRAALEANAEGFGTLALQPPDRQDVSGTAAWSNGLWRVVLVHSTRATDADDVNFSGPFRIPVTFAVWDGSKGDRDGIKLVSGWHWLTAADAADTLARKGLP